MTISHWYFEGNTGRNFQQRSYCRVSPDAWWSSESGAMGMELQPRFQQGRVMSSMPCQPGKTTDILENSWEQPHGWAAQGLGGSFLPTGYTNATLALRLKFVLLDFGLAVDQLLLILCFFQDGKFIPLLPCHCTLQVCNLSDFAVQSMEIFVLNFRSEFWFGLFDVFKFGDYWGWNDYILHCETNMSLRGLGQNVKVWLRSVPQRFMCWKCSPSVVMWNP